MLSQFFFKKTFAGAKNALNELDRYVEPAKREYLRSYFNDVYMALECAERAAPVEAIKPTNGKAPQG